MANGSLRKRLESLSKDTLEEYLAVASRLREIEESEAGQKNFLKFINSVWPDFIEGSHHRVFAQKLQDVADGKLKRLIVNMPPRHTKSEFASYHFPAWLVGRNPKLKIIQTTHTGELAMNFGRKMRNLIDSAEYKKIFPEAQLAADSKSAGRWTTTAGGEYFAAGVGGAITGRGADLLIIDDPHSEQDALSDAAMENAYEWYTSGPRQRLQPGGSIVIVMTRWSERDLTAKVLKQQAHDPKADKWEVIEFPAIMDVKGTEKPLWPEFWKLDELEGVKASLSAQKWSAQWLQQPTSDSISIIKRDWWQTWEKENVPGLEYIIQSYDTAFLKKEYSDYSAITTWGVFYPNEDSGPNLILLESQKGRYEFPELKREALKSYHYWEPDVVIIEAKASGTPLTQELRAMGIPVMNFSPGKGQDKHARVNAVAPLFESGMIWAPEKSFSEEIIEECAQFPNGEHDDLVDSMTQALLRFRQGGFIGHPEDYEEEDSGYRRRYVYY
jgi:predicted phage terminase large subunit-like protein|tara:strand:+ start:125 stop:1618 length:1494 start_codon:yes stop_codon:yes gene_type:complete